MTGKHDELLLFERPGTALTSDTDLLLNTSGVRWIRKRDGSKATFEPMRIVDAVAKAGEATGEFSRDVAMQLAIQIVNRFTEAIKAHAPTVELVQDLAEDVLIESRYRKTAKAFIIYREQHARRRAIRNQTKTEIVEQYLKKLDWQVRENSNMAYSLQGLNNYISSGISKSFWMSEVYPPEIGEAHDNGDFHIHDTNQLSVYCVGWDLFQLLSVGFRGVPGKVESAPAKHLRSALGQVVNFFYTLQGEAAGAQAFSSFDTLLAPFIRYDNLDYAQVRQILQEFIFNVNVPTRVGFQSPFTNITLDLQCPSHYAKHPVLRGGEFTDDVYGDFQEEMDTLNRAFFDIMSEGDASGRLFSFPIPTINLTSDFNWENPNLDGLWTMTGKFGIPYFSNFINSDMSPDDARSMCCRLRIDNTQLERRGGGLFGAHPLTGSIGVVTINMPRIGYRSKNKREFFRRLTRMMDLARDSLETKRKFLEELTDAGLYPYTQYYLRDMKNQHGVYWKNHFSTIGLVGMNEACLNLFGANIASDKGRAFAKEVLEFMRMRLVKYQLETGNHYNLEASPAEGTSMRLALKDQEVCPGITCANPSEVMRGGPPFYTNSTHLPVNYTDDPFEALSLQEETQELYTGGTVIHLFLGERVNEPAAVREFVKTVAWNYRLPYFSLTPTFSICPTHGYVAGEHHHCPECGAESEVYSRVVGYLRPVSQWNDGKQAEFRKRARLRFDTEPDPSLHRMMEQTQLL
ncbi:ribonucleoside triphosphate reductase [Cerasicoccus fimbriatus]|uniref:ribonucleoside triphosphate reductase n=1 Tax=Cerasicoccus fimbriatus TaxID=3014554 RepID=UPI0022B4ECAA|nr:ribonucleoside triphosphate reductase [Cerasicoccus sp. TK19100]